MSHNFVYDAPVGYRVNRGFWGVICHGKWYAEDEGLWVDNPNDTKGMASTHHLSFEGGPRTVKAFHRYVRKHEELIGHEVVLVHRCHYPDLGFGLDYTAVPVEDK